MTISTVPNPGSAISLTVIIFSDNAEVNISYAVKSVAGWARKVYLVDSFSTDRTCEIAELHGVEVVKHPFTSVGNQRNWALQNLRIDTEWIFFLDADEYLSDALKEEMSQTLEQLSSNIKGFLVNFNFIYLGRHLKHGDLYRHVIRVVRKDCGYFIDTEGFHEKLMVQGQVSRFKNPVIHEDRKTVADWVIKQVTRIELEAKERFLRNNNVISTTQSKNLTIEGGPARWMRKRSFLLPWFLRPPVQFLYRYLFKLGFLDGWPGLIYCFLLQYWYPLMVEVAVLELKLKESRQKNI
jgi:glycosyltransferase involved in cell wall biosynthesis